MRRIMFVCRSAMTLPAVIDNAASIHSRGWNTSSRPKKPTTTRFIKATKPAALEATARKAVTGVGAPSYVSGAQVWNGNAETLKANPITTNIIPRVIIDVLESPELIELLISSSIVLPVTPKINDIPYSMIAEAKTPIR